MATVIEIRQKLRNFMLGLLSKEEMDKLPGKDKKEKGENLLKQYKELNKG